MDVVFSVKPSHNIEDIMKADYRAPSPSMFHFAEQFPFTGSWIEYFNGPEAGLQASAKASDSVDPALRV